MAVEVDIIEGITKTAIAAIDSSLPVKVKGVTFAYPSDGKFFELVLIQENSLLSVPRTWVGSAQSWGNEQNYSGIMRIILHWPINGEGIYPPNRILADLKSKMPKGSVIWWGEARLEIYDNPSITDVIEGLTENLYPLTVPYQFFHVPS